MLKTLALISLAILSCNSASTTANGMPAIGWIDNNTYRAKAIGTAKEKDSNQSQTAKIYTSCMSAKTQARAKIIQKFANIKTDFIKKSKIIVKDENGIKKTFYQGILRKSKIIYQRFNPQDDSCTVIIEVQYKNLKNIYNKYKQNKHDKHDV